MTIPDTPLEEAVAFQALADALRGERQAADFVCAAPTFERLRRAITDASLGAADRAVRLRHALLYETARRDVAESATLEIAHAGWPTTAELATYGLSVVVASHTWRRVRALPWQPDWLPGYTLLDPVIAEQERRQRFGESEIKGDPWLVSLGKHGYRSYGQRAAVRAALTAPAGSTLLVSLPTGEGKSLVFQAIDRIGYGAGNGGVTLVITPTVTLAQDHALALQTTKPHAYVGGDSERNSLIREAVRAGTQGLVFAAPEAACGPLREALLEAACHGRLRAMVIDEAHLVEGWGTAFRTEFQLLAGLQTALLEVAPTEHAPRTVLLSATLTTASTEALCALYRQPGRSFGSVIASRVRPEITWLIAPVVANEVRNERVIEVLRHLPRPAILYLTQPEDADYWFTLLRQSGFRSLRKVHGDTPANEREEVLRLWRDGKLDLVVATSAFGLGIDYPHVRAVVHACLPETLDRFYQEAGRGGRDGRACLSLLLPAAGDFGMAENVNRRSVISVARGLSRWQALFNVKTNTANYKRFRVNLSVTPLYAPNMKSGLNADWNARVLTLLARAGILRLCGLYSETTDSGQGKTEIEVEILDDRHLQETCWQERVEPLRHAINGAMWRNLELMKQFVRNDNCPATLLMRLYHGIAQVCGGCQHCVIETDRLCNTPPTPSAPWSAGQLPTVLQSRLSNGRLLITYDAAEIATGDGRALRWQRRLREVVQHLGQQGLRKLIFLGEPLFAMQDLNTERPLPWCIAYCKQAAHLGGTGLPPGPELLCVAPGQALLSHTFSPRLAGAERLLLLPSNTPDPERPGQLLCDSVAATVSFQTFETWIKNEFD